MEKEILSEIEGYLKRTGMGRAYFGKVSCGNSELVARLENGGDVTLSTAKKIRDFISKARDQDQARAS